MNNSAIERLFKKVEKTPTCWIWRGHILPNGHGVVRIGGGKRSPVHRLSFELAFGEIPEGHQVIQECGNTRCVRPEHLASRGYYGAIENRFWTKIDAPNETACWLWLGGTNHNGYGTFAGKGRSTLAHRQAWELTNGNIPPGQHVLHHCDNPPCVNPKHLFLGDQFINMRDMAAKGRAAFSKNPKRGSENNQSKLTEEQVLQIRDRYATNQTTQKELASTFNVSRGLIGLIVARKIWTHV